MASSLTDKKVVFIQHKLPGLQAGEYSFTVQNELSSGNGSQLHVKLDEKAYEFSVEAPRFSINPKFIDSVYPPENSDGNFTAVLPHVVLNHQSLPWMRSPLENNQSPPKGQFEVGDTTFDMDVPTWLAVLLLQEDDFQHPEGLKVKTVKVADLFPNEGNKNILSQFSKITSPDPGIGQSMEGRCQVIDLPFELFAEIAPSLQDLSMMAHLREVRLDHKPIQPEDAPANVGAFATIVGNRLPALNKVATAVLVSLEGMAEFLPDVNGQPPKTLKDKDTVRLPCFKSWNFIASGSSFGFVENLKKLNGGASDPDTLNHARLHLNNGLEDAPQKIKDALKWGYTPFNHTTRLGDQTVAWYRGPLTPYPIDEKTIDFLDAQEQVIDSADELLRFDASIGMFDVSYAAAWQLGRLIAIQDRHFSTTLYKWKRELTQQLIRKLEEDILQGKFLNPSPEEEDALSAKAVRPTAGFSLLEQALEILSNFSNDKNGA